MESSTKDQCESIENGGIGKNRKRNEKPPLWDSFQDPPSKRSTGSATNWGKLNIFLKIFKAFTYVFVFFTIIITTIISKLSFMLMVAQIQNRRLKYCVVQDMVNSLTLQLPKEEQIAWVWAIIISFSVPEIFTFFRSLRIFIFKYVKTPTRLEVLLVCLFEILHVIGLALFTFLVLPNLDSIRGLMLSNCVCFIPILLFVFSKVTLNWSSIIGFCTGILALVFQATSFVVWPAMSKLISIQILIVPLILISCRWWENYTYLNSGIAHFIKTMRKTKSRYQTYLFLSPIKIVLFSIVGFALHGYRFPEYLSNFSYAWKTHHFRIENVSIELSSFSGFNVESNSSALFYVLFLQIVSSYLCYIFAKFACKIKIQKFSFSLPFSLIDPISVAIIILLTFWRDSNVCVFHNYVPDYLSFNSLSSKNILSSLTNDYLWLWVLWWLSQLWVTAHIWYPKNDKNSPTEKLFVCPWYCPFLIAQCITMNRRIIDWSEEYIGSKNLPNHKDADPTSDVLESDKIPQLIICATMWHETLDEMMEFLKSIVRLDEDQCARRMAKIHINGGKPDDEYYELETNIFFDDAFILDEDLCENLKNPPINDYVKILVTSIEKAAFEIYGVFMKIKAPIKTETPYGGRLVWTLPGRSKLIAHLKNKDKIRHKKRWSQVMYMYYLLGFRIMELENLSPRRKTIIAENTFLLALDGDIDFQPKAVQLLLDRMKAIEELGAACGRIHPVGRGPMVWYQIFEYAIGHWLQKATEHVIGCVLCSPGCFSLFRGSALMENSVMKKYTTISTEPMHYIQYDQGEDRWLCTLILKQGLRVEYSAASDAYTHSPEIFNEFYNQRRRWVPSTIANIFDLLSDADMVVKNNSSISTPYIIYQAMLMVGTILGPGTIFLMMVGAVVTVFSIDIWTAFLWNFIPLLCFILSCIYLKQQFQLLLAFVISSMYCLVMMAVLIGIIIQMIDDGPFAPASLFFLLVFLQIFIAGLVHPQESAALICGFIYYITIPSMYMLLLIYSVFNMNDVSWGTREVAVKKVTDNNENAEENIESKNYLPGWINDQLLVNSELGEISLKEKRFWKDLIKQYLKPMFHTKEKKAEIAESLQNLRNMFAFAFVMINSIFVLVVFLLQLKKDYLHLEWPLDPTDYITYDDDNSQIYIYRSHKELDPIGLCFVVFFGLILIIQFIAMFFHRFATISQLLATTSLDFFGRSSTITDEDAAQEIKGNAINIARQLQRPKRLDEYNEEKNYDNVQDGEESEYTPKRQTIFKLHENRDKNQLDYSDLPRNFERRFLGEDDIKANQISMSRKSLMMLNETRHNAKRRLTQQLRRNTEINENSTLTYQHPSYDLKIL
ncbi:chitin synthase chs-2 [Teleopsis dalmanni]|uniref:chitin synthase chs-2 n=1 Tax=Teleopsis dalmanni TaxID=139649 RepID=UPI0018CDE0E4|nr:chitin synthase chs-2 [Teleopsis dalmanni]